MKIHEHLLRVDIVRRGEVREIPAIEKRTLTAEGCGKMGVFRSEEHRDRRAAQRDKGSDAALEPVTLGE